MKSTCAHLGVAALAFVAASCASTAGTPPPPPPPVVDTVFVVDTVRVETESAANPGLQAQIARLEFQMLERNVQLEGMQDQLDATRQEVVRNLAKLQSQANRAEAASGMAEAEIALESLRRAAGGEDLPEFTEARERIAESSTEFGDDNYGGALYLATQARALARGGQARLRRAGAESLRAGESRFAIPIPMQTVQRSNVRGGPSLNFDIRFTLDPSTPLVGHSYTSQWVRIVDDQGRPGWIFHTLVTGRDPS